MDQPKFKIKLPANGKLAKTRTELTIDGKMLSAYSAEIKISGDSKPSLVLEIPLEDVEIETI